MMISTTTANEMNRDEQLGYYKAQLRMLRAIFEGNNLYLSTDNMKLARAILGFTTIPALDEVEPIPAPISDDEKMPL